jgi:phenylalanyl-tRNA synthetase beta chain
MAEKEQRGADLDLSKLSDRVILKIDVSANRYDLLCEEGLARSLRVFLGLQQPPIYQTLLPSSPIQIHVKKQVCISTNNQILCLFYF